MSDLPPEDTPLVAVGQYARFSHAQDRGLVAAAMDLPYWVIREGAVFVLYVEPEHAAAVTSELENFEAELQPAQGENPEPDVVLPKTETISLFVAGWAMSMFWAAQNLLPPERVVLGRASSGLILGGEWWRVFTGLTLHGDFSHFLANLFFGLLFAMFLQPRFGGGVGWLLIVLAGALGNAANAWFYSAEIHNSIGASTAVFGALGLLVAWELMARWLRRATRNWWRLIVPLGGGMALLAYLGVGDEQTNQVDFMAHFWGFTAGILIGLLPARHARAPVRWQRVAAVMAFGLPVLAWWVAWLGRYY